MTDTLLAPLNDLQALSQMFFQSLSSAQGRQAQPPPISALLGVDAALSSAVKLARTHQVKQRKIEKLKDEVLNLEGKWREIVRELDQGKRDLEVLLADGEERVQAIDDAKAASIPYPELLAYAQSLSSFTSAPPHMPDTLPGQPLPPLFFPPFPNEEKMRRGHMNTEAPLGMIGETHSVGRPPTISPKSVELPPHMAGPGANPYRPYHRGPHQLQFFDLDLDLNPDL